MVLSWSDPNSTIPERNQLIVARDEPESVMCRYAGTIVLENNLSITEFDHQNAFIHRTNIDQL